LKFPDLLDLTPFSFALSASCFPFLSPHSRAFSPVVSSPSFLQSRVATLQFRDARTFFFSVAWIRLFASGSALATPRRSVRIHFCGYRFPRPISDPVPKNRGLYALREADFTGRISVVAVASKS